MGDGLYLQEDDTEEDMSKTWLAYLMKLETYLLALAIVGCRPRDPPPTTPESLSSVSLDYVQVPYDTLFRYYARRQDLVYRTADSKRLSVLQHLDVEERGQWSARTAVGTSLGSVIHAVHRERDALWIAGALPGPVVGVGGALPHHPQRRGRGRRIRPDGLALWSTAFETAPLYVKNSSAAVARTNAMTAPRVYIAVESF